MKAKRRHELKTNELAQSIQDLRFYLQRRGGLVLGVSVAAILVLIVGTVWRRSAAQARSDAWQSYYNISSQQGGTERVSSALTLADNTADPTLARLALQLAAQIAWAEAHPTGESFDTDKLKQAEQAYERLLATYPDKVYTVGTAHRGLAAIAEEWADQATGTSDREAFKARARKHYQAILDDNRLVNLPAGMVAEANISSLDARLVPLTLVDPPPIVPPTADTGVPSLLARPTTAPAVTPTTPGSAAQPTATPTTAPATSAPAPTTAPAAQ